jgi:membrane fusion protein, macrolide-specific efflux system
MKTLHRRTNVRWALLTAVVVPAAVGVWMLMASAATEREANPSRSIVEIVAGDIEEVVTAQGKLEPKEYVDVGAQVSGSLKW